MYVHSAFKIDAGEALQVLRNRAFGLFVVPTAAAPFGAHVPFLVDETPKGGLRAELHVARANPLHRQVGAGCPALLACQGPDAYVSPDWYGIDDQVPTWTYVAVHLTGTARLMPEDDRLAHVDRLAAMAEERLRPKPPWKSGKMAEHKRRAMLKAIEVIVLEVDTVEAQAKLVQHKTKPAQQGVIAGLRGRGDAGSFAIAAQMEETTAPLDES